jgi:hypothetical protein
MLTNEINQSGIEERRGAYIGRKEAYSYKQFAEESLLFKWIGERLNQPFVEVCAPVTYDDPAQRRLLLNSIDVSITDTIASFYGKGGDHAST